MNQCPISGELAHLNSFRFDDGRTAAELVKQVSDGIRHCSGAHEAEALRAKYQRAVVWVEYWLSQEMLASQLDHSGLSARFYNTPESMPGEVEEPDAVYLGLMTLAAIRSVAQSRSRRTARLALELLAKFLPVVQRSKRSAANRLGKKGPGLATKSELMRKATGVFARRPYSWKQCASVLSDVIEAGGIADYELEIVENDIIVETKYKRGIRLPSGKMRLEGLAKELNTALRQKFSE